MRRLCGSIPVVFEELAAAARQPSSLRLDRSAPSHDTAIFAADGRNRVTRPRKRGEMHYDATNPLIVQGDRTVLVEVDNPRYAAARDALAPFAELEKSPEHVHTYRLTPLSLWNAAAAGMSADEMIEGLGEYSKFPLPTNLAADIAEQVARYGRVKLEREGEHLKLVCPDKPLLEELVRQPKVRQYLGDRLSNDSF